MKTKLRKKALFPAITAVVASVIALSSVSYAWFTIGNNAKVDSLDVKVKAADGMQISVDGSTWKSELSVDDLKATTYGTNQLPSEGIYPVSSVGTYVSGVQEMFKGTIDNAKLTATKETDTKGTDGNYMAFDVYFNMSSDKDIYLDTDSAVSCYGDTSKGTEYSARVSFTNLGFKATPAEARELNGTNVIKADYIWEPNALNHTQYVVDNNVGALKTETTARTYNGVNKAITTAIDPSATDDALSAVATSAPATLGKNTDSKLVSLKAGINKVRVYIWVEGQDIDCNNDVSVDGIKTVLNFVQGDPVD